MPYVDLHRRFSSIEPDQPFSAEAWQGVGRGYAGGLGWDDLLERPRVVVLAEASAGKSAEFRARVDVLRQEKRNAFYVTVESLASYGLDGSLGREDADRLASWHQGSAPAWFFLDSVDEARLNHKGVEQALNRLARELGQSYDRARILLSCRGSIWTGKADLDLVRRTLRVPPSTPEKSAAVDPDEALLRIPETATFQAPKVREILDITVVALTKLSDVQRKTFLTAASVTDVGSFEKELYARGLQQLAERPGDLQILASYWQKYRKFGSLSEMLDLGIAERLVERGDARRTLSSLSDEQIRAGAERLAAALVLGRSMNLSLPGQLPDEQEAIDPRQVLGDWPAGEIERLLERGLFVPATFGLVRFYHRSAQEYLAACWFKRMGNRLNDPELHRIFLADALGIQTIPPSLRATAAWLALWRPTLRRHILDREPLVLLEHGDPGALSLEEKQHLLATFAERDASGDLAYSRIDHQSLWMFVEQALAPAINAAAAANPREHFRFEMLRLIEEGEISGCLDMARAAALEPVTRPYHRIVATRVLRRLNDDTGLEAVAADVTAQADQLGPELAPSLAVELFPKHLSVDGLLTLIAKSKPGREYHSDGFKEELVLLFDACASFADREALIAGLAKLPFEPPLDDWPSLSRRYRRLAERLAPIARRAVIDSDQNDYGPPLIRLLMAVERAGWERDDEDDPALSDLIAARPSLRQALFWADVAYAIEEEAKDGKPLRSWRRVSVGNRDLWSLMTTDTPWLEDGLHRDHPDERRVALSALIELARATDTPEEALDRLATLVSTDDALTEQLAEARAPYVESDERKRMREKNDFYAQQASERKAREDQFWRDLRDRLIADPEPLRDPEKLKRWPGPLDLLRLSDWLAKRAKSGRSEGARSWQRLSDAFGDDVAQAYRDGMKILWRVTKPERPKTKTDGSRTVKYAIILSEAALRLEASEDVDWAKNLSAADAQIAALHACLDDQGTQPWLGGLLEHHPEIAAPPVVSQIEREWAQGTDWRPLLEQAAHGLPIPPALRAVLLRLIRGGKGGSATMIDVAARILARLNLSGVEQQSLSCLFDRRLSGYRRHDQWEALVSCLAILFLLDQQLAADRLLDILATERRRRHKSRAYNLLARLFGRHRGIVGKLNELAPATLAQIILEAYRERDRGPAPQGDTDDSVRDRFDEAGGSALSALLAIQGSDAHQQMLWLSKQPAVGRSAHRLRELAYEMAERNSERPVWPAARLKAFEDKMLAPIANGADLMGVALDLLDAIEASFGENDMSSRAVVGTAENEAAVQEWLGDALNLRSDGRFHAHREAQVVHDDRPDIILSSSSSTNQLAIEVKHGDMGWSLAALRAALAVQLAEQYLLPANRRHGILVISHHREIRFWKDKAKRRRISFSDLITELQRQAETITSNATGPITVAVRGLDATPGRPSNDGQAS
ncbi:hypothetical protein J2W40_002648 [Sphingobium xenophagum]|uniref:ATP-binding protein n=1 Tax=Sphingobium xenophagum TaxID=121428 RepID=A0ABU1X3U9_SPHXE|nr:hypothetical protein [Sphingobium xenophagum]MDR7155812.1 hypothetical protein [Sphingobium xenophagum]